MQEKEALVSAQEHSHNANAANVAMLQRELLLLKKRLETVEGHSEGKCSIVSKSSMEASLFSSAARKFLGIADRPSDKDGRDQVELIEAMPRQAEEWSTFGNELVTTSLGRLGENANIGNLMKKVDRSGSRSAFEERVTLGKRPHEDESKHGHASPRRPQPLELSDPISIDLVDGEQLTPRKRGRPKKGEVVESALKRRAKEFYKQSFGTRRKSIKSVKDKPAASVHEQSAKKVKS